VIVAHDCQADECSAEGDDFAHERREPASAIIHLLLLLPQLPRSLGISMGYLRTGHGGIAKYPRRAQGEQVERYCSSAAAARDLLCCLLTTD
jgi:hypothetical protein